MLALSSPTAEASEPASVFTRLVTEPEIQGVSSDLFVSGHYNLSVAEAFKAVDKFISERVPHLTQNGTTLMDQVFAPGSPHLRWSKMETSSEIDEQKGYHRLYSGAMLGIRNPTTHEFGWVDEPELALELIVFAQHLLRKVKLAELVAGKAK
ncbi:TIGR02391 family protein [Mesorhizobium sp. A623]